MPANMQRGHCNGLQSLEIDNTTFCVNNLIQIFIRHMYIKKSTNMNIDKY